MVKIKNIHIFLISLWLTHSQLWAIVKEIAHSPDVNLCVSISFLFLCVFYVNIFRMRHVFRIKVSCFRNKKGYFSQAIMNRFNISCCK